MRYNVKDILVRGLVLGFLVLILTLMGLAVYQESLPKPPHWETKCSHSHDESYMTMETQPSGGGAPGGAYPVIHYVTVCDAHVRVWVTDPRWKEKKS